MRETADILETSINVPLRSMLYKTAGCVGFFFSYYKVARNRTRVRKPEKAGRTNSFNFKVNFSSQKLVDTFSCEF